ncbi:MAG: protein kinase, partial [Gemmatimonadetes bacterium]|nr:protein kinase [Gemmatimonadota bacterium]
YYVMPLIEGESLRAKLVREGELPVGEAVRILRDVADALAYSHEEGVVHRDIKPDNVLLSRGHAVVTDFGVAKAVSDSTGGQSLTSMGVALGTPAYMAPEQAAANPHIDHRADIYALGAMAYEMLCGRPPFDGPTPQAVLSAQVTQQPEPMTMHRSTIPAALNELVMRCLAKLPADRWQKADDLKQQFEAMTTPSAGVTPTGTQPVVSSGTEAAIRQAHPVRVAGLFGLASIGALAIVYVLMTVIGLPDWVLYGAIGLLVVGLPIMLLTGHHERQRAMASTTGLAVTTPTGIQRHFTWRKAILGGGLAFAGLGVASAGYMAMRTLGIGPVGTLVATGVLEKRQPILLAEFANRTADSTLGPSVTEAFRVDLSQSPMVRLVDASVTAAALTRMERDPNATLDLALAREIAEREGITAIVSGEIGPVGRGYVLTASVLSASDGEVLTAVRETADDDGQIIAAIDRLSAKLRERIGESLRTIRANPPLDRVSTGSIEALRKYSQAIRADQANNQDRALALLEEATALDTAFAMAYRKQAIILGNTFAEQSKVNAASSKAYEHRDRLTDVERYLTTANYYGTVEYDPGRVMDAYRAVLEIDSTEVTSLNNLAVQLNELREWEEAEALALRGLEHHDINVLYTNAMRALVGQGKYGDATDLVGRFIAGRADGDPSGRRLHWWLRAAMQDYEGAREAFSAILETQRSLTWRADGTRSLAAIAETQGQLGAAARYLRQNMELEEQRGVVGNALFAAARLGSMDVRTRGRGDAGIQIVEEALARH